ncbi:lipid-A-disaccharide synthase [Jannaschia ovalis]|uniref:Lipid-A-disaccharide synthase n=1 Tax=Jannaschia ovalis TaxID=3038773 RepID=A0ABY8LDP5_9RHOB|nr:lipid-A-disaccharide synthase [Jannaschia sp. GRR-S6-38]WGH78737.1 lipid-A-disaccharide synthase [Jannaschia sp. GRR-S6-38]
MTHLFLIAGEPSGDRLGAALIAGLRQLEPGLTVSGIGGPLMAEQGLDSLFPMEALSVMGLAEVLPRLPELFRRRDEAVAAIADARPDALVTIDSPDFCLRVARKARDARPDLKTIHYVAPSVWAWRPARADRMARVIDHVLALLPFEPPYMERAGMSCDFVGHPVVAEPRATPEEVTAFRAAHGIDGPVALVLPGSRRGEISRLVPIFGAALARLPDDARVVIPTLPHLEGALREASRGWKGAAVLVTDPAERRAAFASARAALAASGTVSLELAANAVPMVIAYDMNWFSWQVISRMMRVDTVTLVNLISETRAVPEFLGPACRAEDVGRAFAALMLVPSQRERQRDAMAVTMERLGQGGEAPGLRAARSVLAQLDR